MITWLFKICVGFLQWLGAATHLTYVEISVIFNLWIQGGVLVLSAALPFGIACYRCLIGSLHLGWVMLTGISFAVQCAGFIWLLVHYGTNMTQAFDLCVDDLMFIAKMYHTTYYMVNILIFVLGWIAVFATNCYMLCKLR